jgi:ABC-type lipoprotein export system ATPase subunit
MRRVKIIKNATGYILPGQTLYIMGSTGSGKSTLLNMISDRIYVANGATLKRKVLINDSEPLTHVNFGKYCAFVA